MGREGHCRPERSLIFVPLVGPRRGRPYRVGGSSAASCRRPIAAASFPRRWRRTTRRGSSSSSMMGDRLGVERMPRAATLMGRALSARPDGTMERRPCRAADWEIAPVHQNALTLLSSGQGAAHARERFLKALGKLPIAPTRCSPGRSLRGGPSLPEASSTCTPSAHSPRGPARRPLPGLEEGAR
jgi:hypothetical protein